VVAYIPSTLYRYYVEYKEIPDLNMEWRIARHRQVYIYTTSELTVREILDDYEIISINKCFN